MSQQIKRKRKKNTYHATQFPEITSTVNGPNTKVTMTDSSSEQGLNQVVHTLYTDIFANIHESIGIVPNTYQTITNNNDENSDDMILD